MSLGSPAEIMALLRTLPLTTMLPMILQMSRTSTLVRERPTAWFSMLQIFSTPSIRISGPLATPPKVLIGVP